MKKPLKYLAYLFTLILVVIIYFYLKPAIQIEQCVVENDVPIKIGPYSSKDNDSVLIYIPYKFRVSNNRLQKIEFGIVIFNNTHFNNDEQDLHFDNNGNVLGRMFNNENLEKLLFKKEYYKYLKLYYNNEIFPFADKEYYFYKPFLVKKLTIEGLSDFNDYTTLVSNFFNYQTKRLHNKSSLKVRKQTIDSLCQNDKNTKILLNFDSGNRNDYDNKYEVEYYLNTNKQTLIDNSKMTREEIKKYLSNKPFDK